MVLCKDVISTTAVHVTSHIESRPHQSQAWKDPRFWRSQYITGRTKEGANIIDLDTGQMGTSTTNSIFLELIDRWYYHSITVLNTGGYSS